VRRGALYGAMAAADVAVEYPYAGLLRQHFLCIHLLLGLLHFADGAR